MQSNHTSWTPAVTAPAVAPPIVLTRCEQAEAEATADLLHTDLDTSGTWELRAVAARRRILPRAIEITESDLAEAECVTDLCHVDDAA